jgi:hypothetical protein
MLKLPRLVPLVAMACLLALPSVALADSFTVFVGYADNLRASGFFPTPWLGAGTVVSQTPPGQSLDTGAIRIDNTGATSIMITNFSVAFNGGSPTIAIWSPLTISPSMRRPVSVKSFLSFCLFFSFFFFVSSFSKLFPFSQAASVATLPSALFVSDCRSVQGGCT